MWEAVRFSLMKYNIHITESCETEFTVSRHFTSIYYSKELLHSYSRYEQQFLTPVDFSPELQWNYQSIFLLIAQNISHRLSLNVDRLKKTKGGLVWRAIDTLWSEGEGDIEVGYQAPSEEVEMRE